MKNIITILGLSLVLSFGSFAGSKNPMPQLLEGEYGIDTDNNDSSWSGNPDGDIDVEMSSSSSNHPIEFSINIPINPEGQSATLVLDVLDIDVDCKSYVNAGVQCEVDEVYVNDTKIGVLNGKNDEWARNRLSIPEDVLIQGDNRVEIRINTLEQRVEANWVAELNWAYITGLSIDPNKLKISRCWVAPQEVRPGDYVNFFAKVRGNPESVNVYNGDLKVLDITDPDGDGIYSGQFQAPTYWADSENQSWKSSWVWQATKEGQESVCPGFKLRQGTIQVAKAEDTSEVVSSWKSSEGTIMTIKQSGAKIRGVNRYNSGVVEYYEGTMKGSIFDGYWHNNDSGKCSEKFNTTRWGRVKLTFSGDEFKGNWSRCSDEIDPSKNEWTGTRIDY